MAQGSLWNRDKLSKIDNTPDYLKEIFRIKDGLFLLKDDEKKKEKAFNAARTKRRFQEDKLDRAYAGLDKFRK